MKKLGFSAVAAQTILVYAVLVIHFFKTSVLISECVIHLSPVALHEPKLYKLSASRLSFSLSADYASFDIVSFETMDSLKSRDNMMDDDIAHCSETSVNRQERNFSCIFMSKFQDILKKIDLFALVFSSNIRIPFSTPYATDSLTFSKTSLIKYVAVCMSKQLVFC